MMMAPAWVNTYLEAFGVIMVFYWLCKGIKWIVYFWCNY